MRLGVLLLIGVLVALTATCAVRAQTPPDRSAAVCDESKAQFALGSTYSKKLGGRARKAAHARTVRTIKPGQLVTMEFDGTRLNLYLNERGVVRSVKCG